jgi:PAS domain S-box-containing protein
METRLSRILLEQSDLGVMVLDEKNRVVLWNDWLVHRSGKTSDLVLGRPIERLFPDLPPHTLQTLAQVLEAGHPRILSPIIHPTYFPLRDPMRQSIRLIPLPAEEEQISGMVILIQDVSAQLDYEEALEERFRLMVEGAREYSMIFLDGQGRIHSWDGRAEIFFGYQAGEIMSKEFSLFCSEENRSNRTLPDRLSIALLQGRHDGSCWLLRKNGSRFLADLLVTVLKDSSDQVRGYALMIRDITEHHEAKKALWDSLAQRKTLEKERERTMERLKQAVAGTVQVISQIVERRDPYTAGHQQRVSGLAQSIAGGMGLSVEAVEGIRMAGMIHDLGKIAVPAEILVKPSRLSDLEMKLIRVHPETGFEIIKNIDFPWPLADIVHQHHERMDGSGYPQGLKGQDILLEARILAAADVVEAMSSHRPYRPALGIETALEEIEKNQGTLYDPQVVEVCLRLFREKGFGFE